MPYLSFDLDAMEQCPLVGAACHRTPGAIAWGLLQMWRFCWRSEIDVVSPLQVGAFFSASDDRDDVLAALSHFGFLEPAEGGLRVRGVAKYLRVQQAKRDGGKKGRAISTSKLGVTGLLQGQPQGHFKVNPEVKTGTTSGSTQALTASSEQREKLIKKPAEPWTESERAAKESFFAAYQELRSGLPLEFRNHIDAKPFRRYLKTYGPGVFLRCWRYALASQDPYLRASSVAELCGTKWPRILDAATKDAPKQGEVYS